MSKTGDVSLTPEVKSIFKKVSRTLYLSVNILPNTAKEAIAVAYLFCRALDSVIDSVQIKSPDKEIFLADFRKVFDSLQKPACRNASVGREQVFKKMECLCSAVPAAADRELLHSFKEVLEVYEKLPENFRRMIFEAVGGVTEGMKMDLKFFGDAGAGTASVRALKTAQDLEKYCSFIGGAPGVFWTRVYLDILRMKKLKLGKVLFEEDGKVIGEALQITNIIKDLAEDLRRGRCYIPESQLFEKNFLPSDLLKPDNINRLKPVIYNWIMWAIDRLDTSERFVSSIPKIELALRAAVIWPVYWAMDTLAEAVKTNLLDFSAKPKIKKSRIYSTIISTPPLLLSNTAFMRGYRFRRETLIVSMSAGGI
ncbi:MAG: squalene/phytoene synthase family protein [Elusimicrobia bacterium]|nr:squalene/phytoene synthase family protein [Elusimicrobiota bacterium]